MSKERYVSLVAPHMDSSAQQMPIFLSTETSTIDPPTCAVQPLQNHLLFTDWVNARDRSLRCRSASCACSQHGPRTMRKLPLDVANVDEAAKALA